MSSYVRVRYFFFCQGIFILNHSYLLHPFKFSFKFVVSSSVVHFVWRITWCEIHLSTLDQQVSSSTSTQQKLSFSAKWFLLYLYIWCGFFFQSRLLCCTLSDWDGFYWRSLLPFPRQDFKGMDFWMEINSGYMLHSTRSIGRLKSALENWEDAEKKLNRQIELDSCIDGLLWIWWNKVLQTGRSWDSKKGLW